jgi:peptidoglycan/LPS O-acetylase OafA/YrhL
MDYRPDIDGLRAIAVLLVVFDHVGLGLFSGGFVGVDVFFVISGFLITGIVSRQISAGRFSMGAFLVRRMKRLLPALLLMVAVTAVVFSFVMLPSDLLNLYWSVIWVVLYLGNVFFWRVYGGYFGGDAQEAPLLHTWSLAIEEQYYLIWPVALLIVLRTVSNRTAIWLVGSAFVAATYVSQLGTEMTFGAAYYLLPTRFFELLLGSWLALSWSRLPQPSRFVSEPLAVAGLAMIVVSSLSYGDDTPFPGYSALPPIVGTALLIYSRGATVNRLLSLRPLTFVGGISYSMYLWHWPLVTLLRYIAVEFVLLLQLGIIALTSVFAFLSWKYVEQPLRFSAAQSFGTVSFRYFVAPAGALVAAAAVGIASGGFVKSFSPEVLAMDRALRSAPEEHRSGCHSPIRDSETDPNDRCVFGDLETRDVEVLLLGDSHANHFMPFLEVLLEDAHLTGQDYTMDTCRPVVASDSGEVSYRDGRCRERNQRAFAYVDSAGFDYVVLAAVWPSSSTKSSPQASQRLEEFERQLLATINRIVASGAVPVLIEGMPSLGHASPKCPLRRELFDETLQCDILDAPNRYFTNLTDTLMATVPELIVLRPREVVCRDGRCLSEIDGTPLFRDQEHLNLEGSRLLGRRYLEGRPNPFVVGTTANPHTAGEYL